MNYLLIFLEFVWIFFEFSYIFGMVIFDTFFKPTVTKFVPQSTWQFLSAMMKRGYEKISKIRALMLIPKKNSETKENFINIYFSGFLGISKLFLEKCIYLFFNNFLDIILQNECSWRL